MISRRQFSAAGLLAASGLATAARAQQVIRLTAVAGHPPVFLWVKYFDEVFIPEVDNALAASGGKTKVEWTKAWGGTLVKLGGESKGIVDGVADIGFVSTIFEAAKFPMQNVCYATPFTTDDIALVTRLVNEMQDSIPAMAQSWPKNGLVYLGGAALDGYNMWTNFPLHTVDDLKGKKIIAPGPAANWIKDTGAVAVAGNLNTYYEDIKSGVASGVVTFATGAWGAKVHEVAPYITKVTFGAPFAGGICVNKSRFDKFPPELQKALRDAGASYAQRFAQAQTEAAVTMMKRMQDAGAKLSELPAAERKRWADTLPPIGKIWAADLQAKGFPGDQVLQGYMAGLKKAGVQVARDWAVR
ncbi:MAG: C4-dicarboxylate TRAP transporter substrate-binding protein [Burkholderiaceae bacterium]|nr:C4-dicarboxylate TRAP transporter substrate-binding protein [Burkholderiaceae bacterium]